jgi:hypothetical protein
MATIEQDIKIVAFEDSRAPRRVLSVAEGDALLRRLSEPGRKPTPAMVEAVKAHKGLLSEPNAR